MPRSPKDKTIKGSYTPTSLKTYMNISINAEKTFEKMQHVFMTKVLERMGMKGTYLNIIKAIYDKVRANII